MRTEIIVVDNFYADPLGVRSYALQQDYYFPYERHADVDAGRARCTWMASRFKEWYQCPFKSSRRLLERLSAITCETVDASYWRASFPVDADARPAPGHARRSDRGCVWNCCFHCKPDNGQRLGEGVHNHVTDTWNSVGPDGWAGLIYLSEDAPTRGGLTLWRNRESRHQFDWMTAREEWDLVDDLGNVPNRLILARGNLPHSGARGWGDSLETGRLYQTFFFRTLAPSTCESVLVDL